MFSLDSLEKDAKRFKVLTISYEKADKTFNLVRAILNSKENQPRFFTERSGTDTVYIFENSKDAKYVYTIMDLYSKAVEIIDKDMSEADEYFNTIERM